MWVYPGVFWKYVRGVAMNTRQAETRQMMEEVLQEDFLRLSLDSYQIEEKVGELASRIVARVKRSDQGDEASLVIEGSGVGSVHAFFSASRDRLAEDFPSVEAILFSSFQAKSIPGSGGADPMDAEVEVTLEVANSYNDTFSFVKRSQSLLRASLEASLEATEYFANSEKAYIRLYHILEHHKKEGRSDLIDKYTSLLSAMVRNTSYEEVSARLKRGEL
jgi:hypothetical protein